jgi:selenocysteine lyase/cysteine desulfurase
VVATLCEQKLMVGSGDFYSVRPLKELSISLDPGVVRLSFVHYATMDEIVQLIAGLEKALA